jgi:hypothetical protein
MLFRSFLQLVALLLFALLFLASLLLLMAYAGYLGDEAHSWADWAWNEAITNRDLIQKTFAVIGAISTLTISALGIYKTWHFADINLPSRLEALCVRWRKAIIRARPSVVPELGLVNSISAMPEPQRGWPTRFLSLIYDGEQAALLRCSHRVDKLQAELKALAKSHKHCEAAVSTGYLELGSLMRRCDPQNGQGVLNLFKKPLEIDSADWDALELAARQALAIGLRPQACDYLTKLIDVTRDRHPIRHARALRFHAEILHDGPPNERRRARESMTTALAVLDEADARDPVLRKSELGLAYETLAKVHIARRSFRLARTAIREAKRHLGDSERLKKLEDRARP